MQFRPRNTSARATCSCAKHSELADYSDVKGDGKNVHEMSRWLLMTSNKKQRRASWYNTHLLHVG